MATKTSKTPITIKRTFLFPHHFFFGSVGVGSKEEKKYAVATNDLRIAPS